MYIFFVLGQSLSPTEKSRSQSIQSPASAENASVNTSFDSTEGATSKIYNIQISKGDISPSPSISTVNLTPKQESFENLNSVELSVTPTRKTQTNSTDASVKSSQNNPSTPLNQEVNCRKDFPNSRKEESMSNHSLVEQKDSHDKKPLNNASVTYQHKQNINKPNSVVTCCEKEQSIASTGSFTTELSLSSINLNSDENPRKSDSLLVTNVSEDFGKQLIDSVRSRYLFFWVNSCGIQIRVSIIFL